MTGVALVHGLWHDPKRCDLVAGRLRAGGTEVVTPEPHRGSLRAAPRPCRPPSTRWPGGPPARRRPDPATASDALYGDCPADLAARAVALLRPQRPGCGRGVAERMAWRDTPSSSVICTADRAVDPGLQAEMAGRCGAVRAWPTGHSPFLSRPDLVVALVEELLRFS